MKKRYLLLFAVFLLAFGALFTLLSAAPLQQRPRDYFEISGIRLVDLGFHPSGDGAGGQ